MKQPTREQWNALPETTTAIIHSFGSTRTVMKVVEETDGLLGRHLAGPKVWEGLLGSERVELVYVPGGMPSFNYEGETLTLGALQGLLLAFDQDALLRMRVDGFLSTPGRPFHSAGTGNEVSLGIGGLRQTVGEFLDRLSSYSHVNREPEEPLVLRAGLPVRIRGRNESSDESWAITGAVQESKHVYLQVA